MADQRTFTVRAADHVGFSVAALDEAVRFFVDGLGGTVTRTDTKTGAFVTEVTGARGAELRIAIVELGGFLVELLEYRGGPDVPAAPPPYAPGMAHLALFVSDLDAALERVASFGWRAQGKPQTIAAGARTGTRVMYVVGPDGATIELMEPAPTS